MAKQVKVSGPKGPAGVAVIKLERNGDVVTTLLAVEADAKLQRQARAQQTIILPKSEVPAYVLANLGTVKKWRVSFSAKEDKMYSASPCDVTLEMRYLRFWSQQIDKDNPKAGYAEPVPTATQNRWGNMSYNFTALFEVVDDSDWNGFEGRVILNQANLTADGGNIAFIQGRDGAALIRQMMLASGVDVDAWEAPYSNNCLPEIDKALRAAGPGVVFIAFNENGYPANISPSARKVKAAAVKKGKK